MEGTVRKNTLVIRSRQSPDLFDCASRFSDSGYLPPEDITSRRIPLQFPHFLDAFQTQTAEIKVPVCGFFSSQLHQLGDEMCAVKCAAPEVLMGCPLRGHWLLLN